MRIRVNNEEMTCEEGTSVLDLLSRLHLNPRTVVVERNREILGAEAYAATRLAEGDTLELLQFVGGG